MLAVIAETWLDTYPNESVGIAVTDVEALVASWQTPESSKKRQEQMKQSLTDRTHLHRIALIHDQIVGVLRAKELADVVHLHSLYVLPSAQGQGVGASLMNSFLDWANHEKEIRLHVASYNHKAIAFYESSGFARVGDVFMEARIAFQGGVKMPQIKMVLQHEEA